MMSRVFKYVQDVADLAEPYVRNAGDYAASTVQYAGDCVRNAGNCVRKKKKAIRRRNFFARLNGIIQFSTNVVAAVIALIMLFLNTSTEKTFKISKER